jgi:hypothetical protein
MKRQPALRVDGAALILAISVLLLLTFSLAGLLSVALGRREHIQKELSRDFAEMEARALLVNLKPAVAMQITQTGGFDLSRWNPGISETALLSPDEASSAMFQRRIRWAGTTSGSAHPELRANVTSSSTTSLLQGLSYRPVATFTLTGRWEPGASSNGNLRAQTPWEIATSISVSQVPLSAFTFYASAMQTVLGSAQNNLGRVHAEGDLIVAAPVDAIAPLSASGALLTSPGGALVLQKGTPPETRAFGSSMTAADYQSQGYGWVFERDSHPVLLVRPVTTAELFSKSPLAAPNKESQRLKPRCDVRVLHGLDASGKDVFTLDWSAGFTPTNDFSKALQRFGDALELDFSKLPGTGSWPSKIWLETNHPEISVVLVKNAQGLRGDLSLATGLHLQVSGSFNTVPPVKKASLMTLGRVISVP